ncbi:MAG: uncharacterized protein JWN68_3297 [Nocardioides sp.]|nr:uncharacterized protein [Nocardioides sp.]
MVNAFADNPEQQFSEEAGIFAVLTSTRSSLSSVFDIQRVADETFCQYLARLSWINDDTAEAVELTPAGRALLKALNSPALEETTADVFEIVLNPDNPFAYAQALSGLSTVKNALLVEPYFRLDQLMDVAEFDNIVRVLVGSRLKAAEYDLLATGIASLRDGRSIEIRKTADLHDRYLIPAEDGGVLMLGASLGAIGKKVSTMTTLGQVASRALRDAHEQIWCEAEPIEPKKPVALPPAPTEAVDSKVPAKKVPAKTTASKKTAAKKSAAPPKAKG